MSIPLIQIDKGGEGKVSTTERITVTFDVDKADFEEARRIMTKLTKDEDPSIKLPLSDAQVAFSLYLNGIDSYFESYGDE